MAQRTEGSALDCIQGAMQQLVDDWLAALDQSGLTVEGLPDEAVSTWVRRALAQVSRWTCVQWGVAVGWWEAAAPGDGEGAVSVEVLRRRGTQRLARWFQVEPPLFHLADAALESATDERVWAHVAEACDRVRKSAGTDPHEGFAALVSTFEVALQIVGRARDGRLVLEMGKANSVHARRRSGSYYTPQRIVTLVLEHALEPAIRAARLRDGEFEAPLRVLDPACGAGLFLVEAAKSLTDARCASHADAERCPPYSRLFQKTIEENIYGVDRNSLAIDWCRLWLWSRAGDPSLDPNHFAPNVRVGDSLVGAPPDAWRGSPTAAWTPTELDGKLETRRLRSRHEREVAARGFSSEPSAQGALRLFADGWCAASFVPKLDLGADDLPTYGVLVDAIAAGSAAPVVRRLQSLASEHAFFHWHLEFPEVTAAGGFDVVLGNPPWIAHAGRAAQPLHPRLKGYLVNHYQSFSGYPTTHGAFVERAVTLLKPGGYLGFVLPSSVSELGGYAATRRAHDARCDFELELPDFGDGCFPGVTQPSMALLSRRVSGGRSDATWGSPWPVARDDVDDVARELLRKLSALPRFEPELFGERGVQSDQRLKEHLRAGASAHERFTTPLREGADIREFYLGPPRLWGDWSAMGRFVRDVDEYRAVRFVVRQTASFTIAALHDGIPFRNSLLGGFGSEQWPPEVLVALLNSSLLRWHHYMKHRDARQPVLPQVKIGHLRAIPAPPSLSLRHREQLGRLSEAAQRRGALDEAGRHELEQVVREAYDLSHSEHLLVLAWSSALVNKAKRRRAS